MSGKKVRHNQVRKPHRNWAGRREIVEKVEQTSTIGSLRDMPDKKIRQSNSKNWEDEDWGED